MNIGVLGAGGFVGRNISRFLETMGYTVCLYNSRDVDVSNAASVRCLDDHEILINCAAYVGGNKKRLFDVNTYGVRNICAELNSRASKPYLVHLSTGAVYGYSENPARPESPIAPEGDYALSKFLGDEIVRSYYQGSSLVARLYFPYGKGQSEERLIPRLINSVRRKIPINICMSETRSMINPLHVEDLSRRLCGLITERRTGVVLLGGAENIGIKGIAELVGRLVGVSPVFHHVEGLRSDMYCIGAGDISLEEGLREVIFSND